MKYSFGAFELDVAQFELRHAGTPVHVEPLVFDLLRLFVMHPGEVIDRDRLIETVWDGRIVSEATIATAIKSARRALGDDGDAQAAIQTVRGRGFRFLPAVAVPPATEARVPDPDPELPPAERRGAPSIAVLPFSRIGATEPHAGFEEAIPHEVILALSRLRSLFVIARGSSFRFRGAEADVAVVGHRLGVRYCLTGDLEIFAGRLAVGVELAETDGGRVIWGERFSGPLDDVHALRAEIVGGIVAAIDQQIQLNEALIAQDRPPESLDAWAAFHLGLKAMHRYTQEGNEAAHALFLRAVALEPGFARAHAGLSFVHFQNAFLRYGAERLPEIEAARRTAERALELDPLEPFANFNMGRAFWLRKDLDAAIPWLERAVAISPNYAQGLYSRAIVDGMAGRYASALDNSRQAMDLSPLDPLLYAMRGTSAIANVTRADFAEASRWGDAAARTPRAHVIIEMIAAATATLAGNEALARHWAETVRARRVEASQAVFFDSLPVADPETRRRLAEGLAAWGF